MATNNKRTVTDTPNIPNIPNEEKAVEAPAKVEPTPTESVYTAAELARAHNTFGTSYAIVATALQIAEKEKATVSEAKEIIEKFKKQEVK